MNATIVKNSTVIAVKDNFKLDMKRDGSMDTCQITFTSTNYNLLNRYDRVTFNGQTWLVASVPTPRMNTETTPDWMYVVDLIELTARLQGYPMPKFTFSQDLAQTRTWGDFLDHAFRIVQVLNKSESPLFMRSDTPSVDLSGLVPDEVGEFENLYQVVKFVGEALDAKPSLNDDGEVNFIPLNDYAGTLTPSFSHLEISKKIDNYATDLLMDIENGEKDNTSYYPNANSYVYAQPVNLAANVDYDNMKLVLPHKIKRLIKLEWLDESDDYAAIVAVPDGVLFTQRNIFEKQEWDTLRRETFASFFPGSYLWVGSLRENSVYWEYGKSEIGNLQAVQKHLVTITSPARVLRFRATYEALPDIQIRQTSGASIDGGFRYFERQNQNAKAVGVDAESLRLVADIRNRQSTQYNVRWTQSTIPSVRARVLVQGVYALIAALVVEAKGSVYHCSAQLETSYVKRSPLTRLISENRIFEIPSTQTVVRKVAWEQNALITITFNESANSATRYQNYGYNLLLNFRSDALFMSGLAVAMVRFKYKSGNTYIAAVMPMAHIRFDDEGRIVNIMRMISNTAVDWQQYRVFTPPVVATSQSAIVTDENGEVEDIYLKYAVIQDDTEVSSGVLFDEAYPFVGSSFFNSQTYGGLVNNFAICDEKAIDKDRREVIQIEHVLKVLGGGAIGGRYTTGTVLNEEIVFDRTKFRVTHFNPQVRIVISGGTYTISGASLTKTFASANVALSFSCPASGTCQQVTILDESSNVLYYRGINFAVTNGVTYTIYLSVGE